METHVKLAYTPKIYVTAERAADVLGITLEKADQLLSGPETFEVVKAALADAMQKALIDILQRMARQRWPQETVPIRVDCVVDLPPLPVVRLFSEE